MEEYKKPEGRRYRRIDRIEDVFENSDIKRMLFGNKGFQFYLFQKRWKDFVGDVLAEESYISGYKGSLLYVQVTNSVFKQHLFMIKQEILGKMQQDEVGKYFKDIRFYAGSPRVKNKPFTTIDPVNRKRAKEEAAYSQPLSDNEKDWIRNWVDGHVKSEKIRPQFAEMMEETLKIRKGEISLGFHPCPICQSLTAPDKKFCIFCERKLAKTRKNKIILLLKENPHYTYQEVRNLIPCEYSVYEEARDILIHRAKEKIFQKYGADEEKRFLLSLLLHKPLSEISKEEAGEMLKKMPQKKW